jgi:phenylalanyl-tRNA synthetase beta chain
MKLSLRLLREMVPGLSAMDPEALYELLAERGAPVEDVVSVGAGLEGVVIGRVKSVRPHPNADRLRLCEVDNGSEVVQVVCGAPVIEEGGFYPFASAGTELPGGLKLKKAKIRGEVSSGMLCSERELDLGRDQSGIMQLHVEGLAAGQSFLEVMGLDDLQIEIEVSPNRGDLLSHVGVAREIASGGVSSIELPEIPNAPELSLIHETAGTEAVIGGVSVRIEEPEMCPRFVGVTIRGVRVGASPDWLQNRLRALGQQPINNIVDATNYVMLEMGNPMHAYDLGKLKDSTLVVRYAREGEEIETLDGVQRKLGSGMMMVCDSEVSHDVAGTMGGEHSSVTDATTDVFLEAALWVPANIRATRRALNISTDASYRFERGVDPLAHRMAIERMLSVILATAGGEVDGSVVDLVATPYKEITLELRLARVKQVLGVALDTDEVTALLSPIGFECESNDGVLKVTVPSYRSYDVTREIDLIEEVARLRGYESFQAELGPTRPSSVPDHPLFILEDELRALLAGWGLFEVVNPAFSPASEGEVELNNPISQTESHLRTSLTPGLVRSVEYNWARGARDLRFFEMGTVFYKAGPGEPPVEATHLALVMTGKDRAPHWDRDAESIDFWTLKGFTDAILPRTLWPELVSDAEPDVSGRFDPRQSFLIRDAAGVVRGRGGRLNPERVDAPAWADELWGMEVELPAEPTARGDVEFAPLPSFPGSDRDLALMVPVDVSAQAVVDQIKASGGALLASVTIFDLYEGEGVQAGHRSLAVRLHLQALDRTLKDRDADKVVRRVLERLREELGVEQRV